MATASSPGQSNNVTDTSDDGDDSDDVDDYDYYDDGCKLPDFLECHGTPLMIANC